MSDFKNAKWDANKLTRAIVGRYQLHEDFESLGRDNEKVISHVRDIATMLLDELGGFMEEKDVDSTIDDILESIPKGSDLGFASETLGKAAFDEVFQKELTTMPKELAEQMLEFKSQLDTQIANEFIEDTINIKVIHDVIRVINELSLSDDEKIEALKLIRKISETYSKFGGLSRSMPRVLAALKKDGLEGLRVIHEMEGGPETVSRGVEDGLVDS